MKKFRLHLPSLAGAFLYTLMAGQSAWADDTEVLVGAGGVPWAKPNVLFIIDSSGSMATEDNNTLPDGTTDTRTRLQIVQDVFAELMNNNSGFNVALMRFDSSAEGGYFLTPMQELNADTRDDIIDASNAITTGGSTPLSETLYEAALYYGGMAVDYGDSSNPGTNHADVASGGNYISPITSQCQKNFTILLTDGIPTADSSADNNTRDNFLGGTSCSGSGNGHCLDDIAGYLHTVDQSSSIPNDPDIQTVETYTIGFTTDQALLEETATAGGGDYITANNSTELTNAFNSILDSITDTNETFSPPAMAANAFNSISNYNKLYFTLFEPAASPKWVGNVKPYALNDSFQIIDVLGNEAVDANGFFLEASRSFWSDSPNGLNIAEGGANSQLPSALRRNLYTYTGTYNTDTGAPETDTNSDSTLSNIGNALQGSSSSSNLTAAMLGLTNPDATAVETAFNNVINTTRSATMGDPLHSKPALVTYGGSAADPDITLFVATNAGFLHAFNASTFGNRTNGEEQFAFIPKELLTNLPALASPTGDHPYGLDGDVTTWVKESSTDDDLTIDPDNSDEHVYVYVGMRRGGSNYYALDVTDRSAPELKWVIQGRDGDEPTTGFSELGQTWSRATVTTIKYGSGTRTVLIFGGGYDTDQDDHPTGTDTDGKTTYGLADDVGRAIYIVDADTGEKIWQAGPTGSNDGSDPDELITEMTNSIPSDIKLVDSDFDGITDRLYVGDMAGQIFRIDLQATETGMSGSGVRIANLGSTNGTEAADNRRFYYPPDVVITQQPGNAPYVSINIGSGYRAGPLNPLNADGTAALRVNDRFYSLRDPYVGAIPTDLVGDPVFSTITNDDLFPATDDLEPTTAELEHGWYIQLGNGNGEKVLAPSVTLNGEIFFTTYTPPLSVETSDCAPPPGIGKLYRVSLFDATPPIVLSQTDDTGDTGDTGDNVGTVTTPTADDRSEDLGHPGIPSAPTIMFHETADGDVKLIHCEGTECDEIPDSIQMEETYWRD